MEILCTKYTLSNLEQQNMAQVKVCAFVGTITNQGDDFYHFPLTHAGIIWNITATYSVVKKYSSRLFLYSCNRNYQLATDEVL